MRNKKLLSTVVATTLAATTMVMPVMAADGGEVDVDVSTRNVVIRVQVPTSLEIAVNQFEKGDKGSQIYSETFGIINKSEIPVKMSVTSKATLDATNPISLLGSKSAAAESTAEDGAAWLAVAAQTSDGKYIEESGKDVKDLTEANENVTTFIQDETAASTATAEQIFYLNAVAPTAPATTPAVTYKKVAPTDADEVKEAQKIAYAQFYELTALATQPTDDATLQAIVDGADTYAIDASDAVTYLAKGTESVTFAGGNTYYSVDAQPTLSKDIAISKVYVYGESADGGKAGFRYVGKLSEKETWSDADIKSVNIKYDITGVTETKYDEVDDDCTYGLYKVSAPAVPESDGTTPIVITYTGAKPTALTIVPVTITGSNTASFNLPEGGGNLTVTDSTITLSASYISMLKGAATRGTGTYKFTVNGTDYTFVIK